MLLIGKVKHWEIQGMNRLIQLYDGNNLKKVLDLKREFVPFRTQALEWNKIPLFQNILQAGTTKGLIFELYGHLCKEITTGSDSHKDKERWKEDLGEISQEQWRRILEMGPMVSVSPSQKVSHLSLLHS